MKTKKILLSLLCVGAVLGTVSCKVETKTPTPETPITEPETTPDTTPDTTPENTPDTTPENTPDTTPEVTSYTATLVYNNGAANGSITSVLDGGKYYFDKPTDPVKQYNKFVGWFTDEALTKPFNFNSEISTNLTLYAKWAQAYDNVNTIWDLEASASSIVDNPSGNVVVPGEGDVTYQNKFTVEANGKSRFEIGSKNAFNTQGTSMIVHLTGEGNTNGLTLSYKWSSGDAGKFIIRNLDTETEICNEDSSTSEVTKTFSNLPAGDYEIVGVIDESKIASLRIYNLSVTEQLPQGPTSGISVSAKEAQVDFLKGRAFNAEGLIVTLDYENGRKDTLTDDKYAVSTVDTSTAGKKTVTVTYQINATTTYTKTYEIVVWEAQSLKVYDYTYNSTTNHARYVYFSDETEKSTDNIIVKAICSTTGVEGTREFILESSEYEVDKTNTNKIEFTYGNLDAEFNYVTVDKVDLSAAEEVMVTVNPEAAVSANNTGYNFHTIMQAMQFLSLAKVSDDATKYILLSEGVTYTEKVEITLPNVVLTTKFSEQPVPEKMATIEYGLLAGDTEPGESKIYKTDGSATVSIRQSAEGFVAGYVKFVNSINTFDEYQIASGKTNETQGVAVLVQADKAQFGYCYFSGYQDTLYAQIGRQYYEGCYIEGHTDFIFGYDATAYFHDCTIMSIGAGADQNNGGYIVATKGNTTTPIEFGYVFDDCLFTADENTMSGSISLARGWDKDMTMAVINSEISGHYSKEAYGYATPDDPATENVDESKKNLNDRYGKMNAEPVAAKLVEYNNTGDGAITASIEETCTVLTAEQAEKYVPANIFTANNGGTKYNSSWNPLATEYATLVIKNSDESVFLTVEEFGLVGSAATKAEYEALITSENTPEGKVFGGFYTDKAYTTAYDPNKVLATTNTLYIKWDDAATFNAITVVFDELVGTHEESVTMANGFITIVGASGKAVTIDANSKDYVDVNGETQKSVYRLKLSGKTEKGYRYIEIDLSNYSGQFKLGINSISSSSSEDKTGQLRVGSWDGESLGTINCPGSGIVLNEFTVEGGKKYYITSDKSGINFYSINIAPITE